MLAYARSYRLPAVVFRLSGVYGAGVFGGGDPGWVTRILTEARCGAAVTLAGDGAQVRDVLYVDDLVDAMLLAYERIELLHGHAFNIGGGPRNTLSPLELIDRLERLLGTRPAVKHTAPRADGRRYFVSDIRAFHLATGWSPRVGVTEGLSRLFAAQIPERAPVVSTAPAPLAT